MFRRLRLQFIFTNLAIIGILFLLIISGVYFLVKTRMTSQVKDFSTRIAEAINSGMVPVPANIPDPNHGGFRVNQPQIPGNMLNPGPISVAGQGPGGMGFSVFPAPNPGAKLPRFQAQLPTSIMFHQNSPQDRPKILRFTPGIPPQVFYVKVNSRGKLLFQSVAQPFMQVSLTNLAQQTFQMRQSRGNINFQRFNYYYYKTPLRDQAGFLIVFMGMQPEEDALQRLIRSLTQIGIMSLIFGLCGSLFMAQRAIRPIQEAWRQQKDFIADASHELRTPLSVIQTNLEVVLSNPQENVASQMDWLGNIKEETEQMADLIASLLFLARADSNQWVRDHQPFDLRQVATRVFDVFKPVAAAKGIGLGLEPDPAAAFAAASIVSGDESAIRRVIEILLDNAIRHTPAGGQITIRLRHEEKKISITVADTGEGIPAIHLDKIFDRFYQVDAARSKGKAGLGLSIAKCIIENHNGAIHVASAVGAGTVFTVQLPLAKEEEQMMNPEVPRALSSIEKFPQHEGHEEHEDSFLMFFFVFFGVERVPFIQRTPRRTKS